MLLRAGSAAAVRRRTGGAWRLVNRSRLKTVTVAILTGHARLAAVPGNVAVSTEFADLEADSVVNVTQLATIDRSALEERVASLPDWLMAQVDMGLRRALALAPVL
jgi:mRNA interferase MazF